MEKELLLSRKTNKKSIKNEIRRAKLLNQISSQGQNRIIQIIAASGTGKTSLLSCWMRENKDLKIYWLTIDASLNDELLFWRYIFSFFADFNLIDLELTELTLPNELTNLINFINEKEEIYFVFDDFHLINNKMVYQTMDYFIQYTQRDVHFIISSRPKSLGHFGTALLMEGTTVFTTTDLLFSEAEAEKYIAKMSKTKLDDIQTSTLIEKSMGWIALLHIQMNIWNNESPKDALFNYLRYELFLQLSEEAQSFLYKTYSATNMSEAFYQGMEFDFNYLQIIDELLSQNMLYMREQGMYQYHPAVRIYFLSQLSFRSFFEQQKIVRNIAKAYCNIHDFSEALRQLNQMHDYEEMMRILVKLQMSETKVQYMKDIPFSKLSENSEFAIQTLYYYLSIEKYAKSREIYYVLASKDKNREINIFLKEIEIFFRDQKMMDTFLSQSDIGEIEMSHLTPFTKSILYLKKAIIAFYEGKYIEAFNQNEVSAQYALIIKNNFLYSQVLSTKALIQEETGYLQDALHTYEQLKTLLETNITTISWKNYYLGKMGILIKQMKILEVEELLPLIYRPDMGSYPSSILHQIEYLFFKNNPKKFTRLCNRELIEIIYNNLTLYGGLLKYLFLGHILTVGDILKFKISWETQQVIGLDSAIFYCRIMLDENRAESVEALLTELRYEAEGQRNILKIIEIVLLQLKNIINQATEQVIVDYFEELIYFAAEEEIFSPFFMEKELISNLVGKYRGSIGRNFKQKEKIFYQALLNRLGIDRPILSKREIEVLEQLVLGLSRKEIAAEMDITLATVKTHILNIHQKLGTSNRTQTIEKGRKLLLIK